MSYDMSVRTGPNKGLGWDRDDAYFSLNAGGYSKYMQIMWRLNMVHDSVSPVERGDWPKRDYNLPEDEMEEKYWIEHDRLTSQHGDSDDPTIPLHKFSTNDWWLVTADEIKSALENYYKEDPKDVEYLIDLEGLNPRGGRYKWIKFLELSAQYEGFVVV